MKYKKNCHSTQAGGRSMIEMLGVLAIIGVLSVGGLAGYNMTMEKIRTNKVVEEIQLIMSALDGFNPGSGNKIPNLNYKNYVDTSSALTEAVSTTGGILGNIGSGWNVRYTFYIDFKNISKELCFALITGLNDGTNAIKINKIEAAYAASTNLDSEEARNICNKASSSDNGVSVEFFLGSI